jgi:hypothetical protein
VLDELVTDDIVTHTPVPGIASDREGSRQFLGVFLTAIPTQHTEVHDVIAEEDRVGSPSHAPRYPRGRVHGYAALRQRDDG